jgi:hypothetical protein
VCVGGQNILGREGLHALIEACVLCGAENLAYWPGARFKYGLPSDLSFPGGSPVVRSAVENGHQSMPAMAK